jgi:hypothetical protein
MAQEREAQPAEQSGNQQAGHQQSGNQQSGNQQAGKEPAGSEPAGSEPPQEPNVNQVRDEPFPASHHDDGRPEPEEESPAPGARGGQG